MTAKLPLKLSSTPPRQLSVDRRHRGPSRNSNAFFVRKPPIRVFRGLDQFDRLGAERQASEFIERHGADWTFGTQFLRVHSNLVYGGCVIQIMWPRYSDGPVLYDYVREDTC